MRCRDRCSTAAAARTCRPTTPTGTGLAAPTPLTKVYDLNAAVGGPIKQDRVWYFVTARTQGSTRANANQFDNLNAGDPTKWLYAPDLSQPGFSDRTWENVSGRLTWQVTPAQQDRRLLGRAVGVPEVRGQYHRHHDAGRGVARGEWPQPDAAAARPAGDVVVAGDQPAAAGGGLRRHLLRLGQFRARPESDARSDQGHRTVCGRLPRQRQSSGHRLSLAGLRRQPHRIVQLERRSASYVTGRAQHEGRVSGHPDDRRSHLVDEHARISGIASTTACRIS